MAIGYNLKRKGVHHKLKLEILSRPVIDSIVEIAPMHVLPNDTLQVTYNLDISGYIDNVCTSTYREKFSYTFKIYQDMTVKYIRFTKHGRLAAIQVYEEMPTDYYEPPGWNATEENYENL